MEPTTADKIRKTADEIEGMTERVRQLAEQNVELTRRAHSLVHDSPDLRSTLDAVNAGEHPSGGEATPNEATPDEVTPDEQAEETPGHS